MPTHLTLFELNNLVRRSIERLMPDEYWVEAELSEVRESRGHCYMELIQKDERSATPMAKASAKCWRQTWGMVCPYFERTTGQMLRPGMKVLLKVYPQFHEAYGFSWIVTDIDPNYTLGDMARKRREIIRQLKEEGVFDLNRSLPMPMFAQRIAVISSPTAAGYGDFCAQLDGNEFHFAFSVSLFQAVMQGEGVERSVIEALNAINDEADLFDCVVIIRGGGATSDMSGFDTLELAENVANFPLPVITGIGHERDESVLDMVSHTRVKTPTAAAAFLISNLKTVADRLADAGGRLERCVAERMEKELMRLTRLSSRIPIVFSMVRSKQELRMTKLDSRLNGTIGRRLTDEQHRLDILRSRLTTAAMSMLERQHHRTEMMGQRLDALDPQLVLSRGYSITLHGGRAVRDASALKAGDEIETRVEKGNVKSIIKR